MKRSRIYKTGKFLDFCRGPHIPSTGKIKAFKLMNIAGAYWLGDEKNTQLQRIYGTSFFSKKDLDAYLNSWRRRRSATTAYWESNSICFRSRNLPGRASSSGIRRAASSARKWKTGCGTSM